MAGSAPPRPAPPPRTPRAPPLGPAPLHELPSSTASGPALRLRPRTAGTRRHTVSYPGSSEELAHRLHRLSRRDFRPSGSRKMAAAMGISNSDFLNLEAFSLSA